MSGELHIAVTGLSGTDDPNPGIGVIQSLRMVRGSLPAADGEWRGRIIGLAYDALDTAIYDDNLVDEVHLLPWAAQGEGALLYRLRQIVQKTPLHVIVPTLDGELLNFIRLESELKAMGISVLLPTESSVRVQFKIALSDFCQTHGFPHPRSHTVTAPEQIEGAVQSLGYPCVVKGVLHGAHMAHSLAEAQVYFNQIRTLWGLPVIIQEFISGEALNVVALADRSGRVVGMVGMRKMVITEKGKAWGGVTIGDEKLLAQARKVMAALQWVGPIELEFIRHTPSGEYYLIEVNPRFPTWVFLAASAGQNLPWAAVRIARGEEVAPFDSYQRGVIFMRHVKDIICSMDYFAELVSRGGLTLDGKRRGKEEHHGR